MIRKNIHLKFIHFLIVLNFLLILSLKGKAQSEEVENKFNSWISADIKYNISKKLQLTVTPELRLSSNFELNKTLLEGGLKYEALKYLDISGGYRFTIDNSNENDYWQRFFVELGTSKKLKRFKTKLQVKYTNETKFNSEKQENYLRYKGGIEYNIPDNKLTPFISLEAFNSMDDQIIEKFRYYIGAEYKINKHNRIEAGYKLDYYMTKYQNTHILKLGYIYKF